MTRHLYTKQAAATAFRQLMRVPERKLLDITKKIKNLQPDPQRQLTSITGMPICRGDLQPGDRIVVHSPRTRTMFETVIT